MAKIFVTDRHHFESIQPYFYYSKGTSTLLYDLNLCRLVSASCFVSRQAASYLVEKYQITCGRHLCMSWQLDLKAGRLTFLPLR